SGLTHCGWSFGAAVGDYDNDGWEDLYITYLDSAVLTTTIAMALLWMLLPKQESAIRAVGAPARHSATTITTATSICTWPTMWTSISITSRNSAVVPSASTAEFPFPVALAV